MSTSTDYDRVLVAGASGGTGREILQELRGTGVTVRAMTTSSEHNNTLRRLGASEVIVGDLLKPDDARRAVDGVDAVLCAVGTRPSLRALYADLVDGRGVMNLIAASREAGVERFVYESAIGVGNSKESMPLWGRLATYRMLRAKDRSESYLRESGPAHTILRPGWLTDGPPTGDVVVGEGGQLPTGRIPRADVARLMVAALFTPESDDRTLEIVSRDGLEGPPRGAVEIEWQYPETVLA